MCSFFYNGCEFIHRLNYTFEKESGNKTGIKLFCAMMIIIMASFLMPSTITSYAANRTVVKVGWHEEPYFIEDNSGRRSGYSYEYQKKVAAYNGWKFEYVKGSWSELFQKLIDGEIDLMSDVSYSDERAKKMIYSSIPMGTEAYYLYVAPDNNDITSDDISSLNGKKVGVTKNSIQKDYFKKWAKDHNVKVEIIDTDTVDKVSMDALGERYDAFVSLDTYGSPEKCKPVFKIGSSDFYFVLNKNRADLLDELDVALNKIQDENMYYDQELHDKYLTNIESNSFLNKNEIEWLDNHKKIVVGYQDNYLAFCAKDKNTGELTGALKDYLEYVSKAFENYDIEFETICYPTAQDAIDALKLGKVDCVFPSNFTDFDAEEQGLIISPPIMSSEMDAVILKSKQRIFSAKKYVNVAVNMGNSNYEIFLANYFPDWKIKYYPDTAKGLQGISKGEVDCVLISSFRYSNISKLCDKYDLTTLNTGVDMNYYFVINEGDVNLYSILAKITRIVPDSVINSSLNFYSTEEVKSSFWDIIKENMSLIITIVIIILIIILLLLLYIIFARKKIYKEKKLVKDLNKKVFVDALTSVRNKGAFNDNIKKLQDRLNYGENFEFGIVILDCNDLKKINDKYGHDKGDIYIKNACQLICKTYAHSPVFRIGGDEFAVILYESDFDNKDSLFETFEKRRKEICEAAPNKWEEVNIASGCEIYDASVHNSVNEVVRSADKKMYENKKRYKMSGKG